MYGFSLLTQDQSHPMKISLLKIRPLLALTFFALPTLGFCAEPIYVEAESGQGGGSAFAMGDTSDGHILRHIGPKFRRTLPVELKEPLAAGRLFVRYGRAGGEDEAPALLQVGIGPDSAGQLDDSEVTQLEPLILTPSGGWEAWRWVSTPIPALKAGSYKIFLHFPEKEAANLDVLALAPAANNVEVEASDLLFPTLP